MIWLQLNEWMLISNSLEKTTKFHYNLRVAKTEVYHSRIIVCSSYNNNNYNNNTQTTAESGEYERQAFNREAI